MENFIRGWLPVLAVLGMTGCASSYVPRPSPRVALVQEQGSFAYVREGRRYPGGFLGGDIVEAVQGVPQAEEYARQYKSGITTGFVLTLGGAFVAIGGLAVVGADSAQQSNSGSLSGTSTAGLVVAAGGLVVELIGAIVAANATPHLFDAINAYNDGVDARSTRPQP